MGGSAGGGKLKSFFDRINRILLELIVQILTTESTEGLLGMMLHF